MTLKTKGAQQILEPIEKQLKKLKELLANNSNGQPDTLLVNSVFCERLHVLAEKFDKLSKEEQCDYQEMKTKITNIIEEFCTVKDINKLVENIDIHEAEDAMEEMLTKFLTNLEILETLECLPLKQRLQEFLNYIKEMGGVNEIEDFQNIKELGTSILEILGPLQHYGKSLVSQSHSEKIALYSCQLITMFNLLVQLIQQQHQLNAPIYTCKKYICERMCLCFQMILEVLNGSQLNEDTFERENHFVYRMDLVLDIIAEMPSKTKDLRIQECTNLWLGIEDIFSHAMAIAQVCQPCNFKAISGACQSIMAEYENLKLQIFSETHDPALNNLFMNTLNDALYRLERKVNISVLTLVMEVFSDPFNALRKLVMTCGNSLNATQRSKSDLTNAIEDFDQLTDKSMQIGMFAIACCKDPNRNIKIRNSLAGFESLENELVSAIVAFYLHPDNKEMHASVKLLTAQWQLEMNKLHNTVDLIIDPAAYCQVILDDMQERISTMFDCLDNRHGITQSHVQGVVLKALSLSSQISAAVSDIGNENIDRRTLMMIRELKAAIFEADAASKSVLVDKATEPQQLRVIKRCELILNVVKRLQPTLETIMNDSILMNTSYRKSGIGQGDMLHDSRISFPATIYELPRDEKSLTYIRTPYTVKNYKLQLTIQPANSVPRTQSNLSCLIPYIKKGRAMRMENSIMYKTPRAQKEVDECRTGNKLKIRTLSSTRQHLFSRDSFVTCGNIDMTGESMDLTNILEKISSLSSTLSSTVTSTPTIKIQNQKNKEINGKMIPDLIEGVAEKATAVPGICLSNLNISAINGTGDECSTQGGGDAPSSIETPERYEDIQRLEKKLDALQKYVSKESKE